MFISKTNKIALLMFILSFCVLGVCYADCYPGDPISDPFSPDVIYGAPVGTTTLVSFSANDNDVCDPNNGVMPDTVTGTVNTDGWSGLTISQLPDTNIYLFSTEKYFDTPGTYDCSVTLDDGATAADDQPVTDSAIVHVLSTSEISGPVSFCYGDCPTFSVDPIPSGDDHDKQLSWYYFPYGKEINDTNATQILISNGLDNSSSITYGKDLLPGKYLLAVRVEFVAAGVNRFSPWSFAKTKIIEVKAFPPPCEVQKCTGSGSGGSCPSGGCGGGGGGFPLPSLYNSTFNIGIGGGIGNMGPGGVTDGDAGGESCPDPSVTVYKCHQCEQTQETLKWVVSTSCFCMTISDGDFDTNGIASLQNGMTLKRNVSGSTWTYEIYDALGGVYTYGSAPIGENYETIAKMGTYTDPDGNVTYYTRTNGGLDSVDRKDHNNNLIDRWTYDHATGDSKITRATAPDGSYTTYSYYTDGWREGLIDEISVKDANGNQIGHAKYDYNSVGRLTSYNHNEKVTTYTYTYNESGQVTKITVTNLDNSQPRVPVTVNDYEYGENTTTVLAKHSTNSNLDRATIYDFVMKDSLKTFLYKVTDPEGKTTKNSFYIPDTDSTWDDWKTATGHTLDDDYKETDNKNLIGKTFKVTDALGKATNYEYDSTNGLLTKVTYATQDTETYSYYSGTSFVKTVKNIRGNYTHYERNSGAMHQVSKIKVSEPVDDEEPEDWSNISAIKEYDYYPDTDTHGQGGRLWKERVPNIDIAESEDSETTYEYYEMIDNQVHLRDGVTKSSYKYWDAANSVYIWKYSTTHYDDMGKVLSTTDANGRTIWYEYDNSDRQTKVIYEKTASVPTVYSESHYGCCDLEWTKDEDGRQTHYAYDDLGRVTDTWTDISGQSQTNSLVHNDYDDFGNVWRVTTRSAANTTRQTSYTFDKNGRVTLIDYPGDLGDEEFGYDDLGAVLWKIDGEGIKTIYRYNDDLHRLTNIYYNYTGSLTPIVYPTTTADVTYTYEGSSNLVLSIADLSSGTSEYTYDINGRLATYTPPNISNKTVSYIYNNLGQKTSITTSITNGNFVVNYEYYANGWLKNVKRGTILIASYEYDSVGNRTKLTYGNSSYELFDYGDSDPRYQLEGIDYAYKCNINSLLDIQGGLDFTRDNSGNLLTWGDDNYSKAYTYDDNSRLVSANYPGKATESWNYDWVGNRTNTNYSYNAADQLTVSPNKGYTYDDAGNLTAITGTGAKSFTYTDNNLVNTVTSGSNVSTMLWDTSGNRVRLTTSTSQVYDYLYDTTAGIPAVIEGVLSGNSVFYIREPDGELIARVSGETIQYYHFDELGSTIFMTDSDAVVIDRYTYDAWGNVTSHTGNLSQPYQYVGRYGYFTHYQDTNIPYIQTGVRLYNPEVGRYMQEDPIKQNNSAYVYSRNMPISDMDSSGLYSSKGCDGTLLSYWIKKINEAITKPKCKAALKREGISDCIKKNLPNLVINCSKKAISSTDRCTFVITLGTRAEARTVLHEAVHACSFKNGLKKNESGIWKCPKCGITWGDKDNPYPYINDEKTAEGVVHDCGF